MLKLTYFLTLLVKTLPQNTIVSQGHVELSRKERKEIRRSRL